MEAYQREKEERDTQDWLRDKIVCPKCGRYVSKYADYCSCMIKEKQDD